MKRWARATALPLVLLSVLAPASAGAQSYRIYGAERFFTVDWEPGERRGGPIVAGYVTNTYGLAADRLRLLVESLDASGQVSATTVGYVNSLVMPGAHVYFEVVVPERAPRYRVVVLSWDWRFGPSGA